MNHKGEIRLKAEDYRIAIHKMIEQINDMVELKRIYQLAQEMYKKE